MTPALRTWSLCRSFGDFEAVRGVTFEVPVGQSFGLLGPNGAGKSTLIRLLTTLLLPSAGRAEVAGCDVARDAPGVRRAIGVIPQAMTSDPELTAAENLDFYAKLYGVGRAGRRRMIDNLLDHVDLADWRNKMVGTFSGGMRRRLEIARSLLHQPRILFLDEPTTSLDPASRIAMWEMLRRLQQQTGFTLFLTTHNMEEADRLCDRLAIFDRGQIIASGTPADLKLSTPASDVLEVQFARVPAGWAERLAGLPAAVLAEQRDGGFRIECSDRLRTIEAVVALARRHGVVITSLVARGNSLEDAYLQFTGRDLRDSPGEKVRRDVSYLYERA